MTSISIILLCQALPAKSQWVSDGPPDWVFVEWIDMGGITYFRLISRMPAGSCCQRIGTSGFSRQGTAISLVVQHEFWAGVCTEQFCDSWLEESMSVFGSLPAGNFTVSLFAGPGNPFPWLTLNFPGHSTNANPTLQLSTANTNGATLFIQLFGVGNVTYVLESSTNLIDWTGVKTNFANRDSLVTFSDGLTNGPQRFYRTSIMPGPSRPYSF